MTDNHYYFYLENGVQKGPVTADQLARAVTPRTLLWREGLEGWTAAEEIPEIRALLSRPEIVADEPVRAVHPPLPPGGGSARAVGAPTKPNNYLIWSILLTLLCGSIPGMVGIALGITCNQHYAKGDYRGAELASSMARNCILVSVVLAVILLGVLLMMFATFGSALFYSFSDILENS